MGLMTPIKLARLEYFFHVMLWTGGGGGRKGWDEGRVGKGGGAGAAVVLMNPIKLARLEYSFQVRTKVLIFLLNCGCVAG